MPTAGLSGILKLIHIVFATVWVGGLAIVVIFSMRAARSEAAMRIEFARQSLVAGRVFPVSAIVALVAGTWLVIREAAWGFDQAWISIGFTGILLGTILGPVFYDPQTKALIVELEAGDSNAGARSRRIRMVSIVEAAVLLVVVWAMVYKPGL